MNMPIPWIALSIFTPFLGFAWLQRPSSPRRARRASLVVCILTLAFTIGGAVSHWCLPAASQPAPWDIFWKWLGEPAFVIDSISAPLLPLAALLYLLTTLASLYTADHRFSFGRMLFSLGVLMAVLSCKQPWLLIALLALHTIPPWLELSILNRSKRVYTIHMALFLGCLVLGQFLYSRQGQNGVPPAVAIILLTFGALIRCGIAPLHCWMTDLFQQVSLRTSLLFVTPMLGAYAAVRLVVPIAPEWALQGMISLASMTTFYAAGMALVQRESRRFFCYLFLSHSSLVIIGLGTGAELGITGALCIWISVGLSLAGFGLTLRALEARTGRLSLAGFNGLFNHYPGLAVMFLLTGLASIGFPGTIGFVGAELLVDCVVHLHPLVGVSIVLGTALNGLAVMHAYFRIFTGSQRLTLNDLSSRPQEKLAVMIFVALIVGGGLYPQPGVMTRYQAATEVVRQRETLYEPATGHGGRSSLSHLLGFQPAENVP